MLACTTSAMSDRLSLLSAHTFRTHTHTHTHTHTSKDVPATSKDVPPTSGWVNAKGLLPRTPDNVPAALREKVSAEAVAIVDARRTQRLTQGKGKGGVELRARYLGDMQGKFTRVTSMLGGASHLLLQRKGAFNTKSRRLEPADIEVGLAAAFFFLGGETVQMVLGIAPVYIDHFLFCFFVFTFVNSWDWRRRKEKPRQKGNISFCPLSVGV